MQAVFQSVLVKHVPKAGFIYFFFCLTSFFLLLFWVYFSSREEVAQLKCYFSLSCKSLLNSLNWQVWSASTIESRCFL